MTRAKEVVYSVTLQVDEAVASEWVEWMRDVHIPEVMATGCFEAWEMRRCLEPVDAGGPAYEIRYLCASLEHYRHYQEAHASALQAAHSERYGGRVKASRRLFGSMETRS